MNEVGALVTEAIGRHQLAGLADAVIRPDGPPVTFRQLLTHTAGIGELPRVADVLQPAAWGLARPGASPWTWLSCTGEHRRGSWRLETSGPMPTTANHGQAWSGQLIQGLSDSLPEYMRNKLFDPRAGGPRLGLRAVLTRFLVTDLIETLPQALLGRRPFTPTTDAASLSTSASSWASVTRLRRRWRIPPALPGRPGRDRFGPTRRRLVTPTR